MTAPGVTALEITGEFQEALGLLTSAGALPGRRVRVSRTGERVVVVGVGLDASLAVSLPADVASHVFVAPL